MRDNERARAQRDDQQHPTSTFLSAPVPLLLPLLLVASRAGAAFPRVLAGFVSVAVAHLYARCCGDTWPPSAPLLLPSALPRRALPPSVPPLFVSFAFFMLAAPSSLFVRYGVALS